jgi:hypothetical protein
MKRQERWREIENISKRIEKRNKKQNKPSYWGSAPPCLPRPHPYAVKGRLCVAEVTHSRGGHRSP